MAPSNGAAAAAAARGSSAPAPQSRPSDRGSAPRRQNSSTSSADGRSADAVGRGGGGARRRARADDDGVVPPSGSFAAADGREGEFPSPPPPPPCSSSVGAFLLYCALPLLLLGLASYVSDLLAGGEGGGPPPAPAGQSPAGRDSTGVTIDLTAAAKVAEEAERRRKRERGQQKRPKREEAGGAGDSELKQEIDALLEKQGKKLPDKDAARKRHQRGGGGAAPRGAEEDVSAARRRAQRQMDPRRRFDEQVERIRERHRANKSDVFRALALADALRQRDLTFHDGGSVQMEAIETYRAALNLIRAKRKRQIEAGEPTNVPLSGETEDGVGLNAELFMDVTARSTDGLLASAECSLGKMYFMANMFERAVGAYDRALEVDGDYLDALCYRASTLIILGRYEEAAENYSRVLELDENHIFQDAYTGLAKILVAKEEAVPGGWDTLTKVLEEEIPKYETRLQLLGSDAAQKSTKDTIRDGLKRMHLAMFSYHDTKTNNTDQAWHHLSTGYRHKMASLGPWNSQFEKQRVSAVKQVFHRGFWPAGVGSRSRVPVFVIGFVRSGSTLTERVLDAHRDVVGTGEDSVFNGRLDQIRNEIVEASVSADPDRVRTTVLRLADMVVEGMRDRWEVVDAQMGKDGDSDAEGGGEKKRKRRKEPKRFVDKMLTNYMNVGFIHMLFPDALILHVARNPMDTCFSAFKHDFPPGTLDYTSDFPSLADLYHGYRDVMEHWDAVLPGRVTHIRYEDMVNDMPNVARKIIDAAGLDWDEEVLNFHRKKQAVNTLSTTQVRKGVYKHHLQAWRKYEQQLRPLVKLLGSRAEFNIKTTLPGYEAPPPASTQKEEAKKRAEPE